MKIKEVISELKKLGFEKYIILRKNNYLKWEISKKIGKE